MQGRRLLTGLATMAMGLGGLVIMAPPSLAGECSRQTGGDNDRVMWTGSKYTCAYTASNGDNKIGAFATEVWTSSTAPGYEKRFKCQRNSGGVSISSVYTNSAGTNIGSSITYTAFNTKDGSRHWTGAVLWNTPKGGEGAASQFRDNCDGYTVKSNLFRVPKVDLTGPTSVGAGAMGAYEITVSTPDGGGPVTGPVSLFHMASTSQTNPNPPARRCDGTAVASSDVLVGQAQLIDGKATISNAWYGPSQYKLYAVFGGQPLVSGGLPAYCATPPVDGLTAGISNTILLTSGNVTSATVATTGNASPVSGTATALPRLRTVNDRTVAPQVPEADCPVGWRPLQANVWSPTQVIADDDVVVTRRGSRVKDDAAPKGTVLRLQTVCRPAAAPVVSVGKAVLGSRFDDELASPRVGSVVFGGIGDDKLTITKAATVGLGGVGSDELIVRATGSAANGGPGSDLLKAKRKGAVLLVGGSGRDELIGAPGRTKMNAADGRPGDYVVCKGSRNKVVADYGDQLVGRCQVVDPGLGREVGLDPHSARVGGVWSSCARRIGSCPDASPQQISRRCGIGYALTRSCPSM